MQAVSGRHGLAAPVPTSCAVAHPSSPAFMLGTISHLAQEQYSTLSIPTNPRQTQPLRPPGMQLAAVLPHDLFLCINSKKKKEPKTLQAAPANASMLHLPGLRRRACQVAAWAGMGAVVVGVAGCCRRPVACQGELGTRSLQQRWGISSTSAHQHTDTAPRSWWGGDRVSPPQFPHDGCSRAAGLHSGACCDCCSARGDDPGTHSLAALPKLEKMMHWE